MTTPSPKLEVDAYAVDLFARYRHARMLVEQATNMMVEIRDEIQGKFPDRCTLEVDGKAIGRVVRFERFDLDITRLRGDQPELVEAYTKAKPTVIYQVRLAD